MKRLTSRVLTAVFFSMVVGSASAETYLSHLRHDPMAAIEAGDTLGLQTIYSPRGVGGGTGRGIVVDGLLVYDIYLNQEKGSILVTAQVLEHMGYPSFVDKLKRMGIL